MENAFKRVSIGVRKETFSFSRCHGAARRRDIAENVKGRGDPGGPLPPGDWKGVDGRDWTDGDKLWLVVLVVVVVVVVVIFQSTFLTFLT